MTYDRTDDVLKDLETALAVTPSPQFADGVRARIADERPRRQFSPAWPLAVAGVLAMIVLVALVTRRTATVVAPPESSPLTAVSSPIVPSAVLRPVEPVAPRISTPVVTRVASRSAPARAEPGEPSLEVITNQGEVLRALWARTARRSGELKEVEPEPAPEIVANAGEIVVPRVTIAPIVLDVLGAGGGTAAPPGSGIRRFATGRH
jgi:hypothetical protein